LPKENHVLAEVGLFSGQQQPGRQLSPGAVRHIGILGFPLRQFKQILLGDLPLLRAVAQMCPLLSGQPFPLKFGHTSTAEYQRADSGSFDNTVTFRWRRRNRRCGDLLNALNPQAG